MWSLTRFFLKRLFWTTLWGHGLVHAFRKRIWIIYLLHFILFFFVRVRERLFFRLCLEATYCAKTSPRMLIPRKARSVTSSIFSINNFILKRERYLRLGFSYIWDTWTGCVCACVCVVRAWAASVSRQLCWILLGSLTSLEENTYDVVFSELPFSVYLKRLLILWAPFRNQKIPNTFSSFPPLPPPTRKKLGGIKKNFLKQSSSPTRTHTHTHAYTHTHTHT